MGKGPTGIKDTERILHRDSGAFYNENQETGANSHLGSSAYVIMHNILSIQIGQWKLESNRDYIYSQSYEQNERSTRHRFFAIPLYMEKVDDSSKHEDSILRHTKIV